MSSILTHTGLEKLKAERTRLKKKRARLVEEMEAARQEGDLSENSAYHQLREDVAVVTTQIAEVEEKLMGAEVVEKNSNGVVGIGSRVTLEISSKEKILELVGDGEVDPLAGKISYRSPLGSSLMGKGKGEEIEVEAPNGKITYKIVAID